MFRIRTILHPTDFSPSAGAAFAHAVAWARRLGAGLHLMHAVSAFGEDVVVDERDGPREENGFYRTLWEAVDARLQALVAAYDAGDVCERRLLARGPSPAMTILKHQQRAGVDLLVLGTRGDRTLRPDLLGSTAAEVMARASCPVLLADETGAAVRPVAHVLLPLDFTQPVGAALAWAKALVSRFGASLDVLYVHHPERGPVQATPLLSEEQAEQVRRQLEDLYHAAEPRLPPDRLPERAPAFHLRASALDADVVAFARTSGADLVLQVAPGLPWAEYSPLEHTIEQLVGAAPCPVLTIRPSGRPRATGVAPSPTARSTRPGTGRPASA